MSTSVLVVDDEPEFLRRFSHAVTSDPALRLAGAVMSGKAAITLLDAEAPDAMLVDLGLPDISGIEVIRHAAQHHPACDILVVTMFGDDQHVIGSIEAGATGYLLKDASEQRIAAAIHELRAGGSPISPGIARRILGRFKLGLGAAPAGAAPDPSMPPSPNPGPPNPASPNPAPSNSVLPVAPEAPATSPLTARETEILRLTAKGLGFDTIGDLLEISPHTVVAHVKKIYRKLAVHSRGEAVYEAGQMGLL